MTDTATPDNNCSANGPVRVGEAKLPPRHPAAPRGFLSFLRTQVRELKRQGKINTQRNYRRALDSLAEYTGGKDIPLPRFTAAVVEDYAERLRGRGVQPNTLSFHMRILRAAYNKAVAAGIVRQSLPFGNVYTGVAKTGRDAVDIHTVRALLHLKLPEGHRLALARDLFVFNFCACGMCFVDLAFLRRKDITGDSIRYVSRKTGYPMEIRIDPHMQAVITRYARRPGRSPYLFPILKSANPAKALASYESFRRNYNRQLRELSALIGLPRPITSATARNSWAAAAQLGGIPLNIIGAALGISERCAKTLVNANLNTAVRQANTTLTQVLDEEMPDRM